MNGTTTRILPRAAGRGAASDRKAGVLVRDLPLRLFHWALVADVAILAATGFFGPENALRLHIAAAYGLFVLLTFRFLWWFAGGRYSRLSAYPLRLRDVLVHLRALARGGAPLVAGHTPAGAAMIMVMMALLAALAASGLLALGGREHLGPLKAFITYETGDFVGEIHEFLAVLLVVAILGHLAGVFLETVIFRHPLLRAMTRGRLPVAEAEGEPEPLLRRGIVVALIALAITVLVENALSAVPDRRWRPLAAEPAWTENCRDCHFAYHPSLHAATRWKALMATLDDHFGEDASVDAAAAARITAFLVANDATTFDTEVAVRIGRASSPDARLVATEGWKRRHRDIAPSVFERRGIASRSNCLACHADAESGRFDDSAISIPER